MKQLLFCVCLMTFASVFAQDVRLKGIEKELNQVLKDQNAAGFAVAVVQGDKVIYSQGFGYRDLENKLPVTPNTLFAIGSTSKAFTCALLGQLEAEHQLNLDDVASKHLPQLQFQDSDLTSSVTIRDLMCHRTGLPRYDFSWYFFNSPVKDSLLARLKYMKPSAELREIWQYNNYMFLAQGMIAEQLTGRSWESCISKQLFEPLGMTRSNTDIAALKADKDASLPYGISESGQIQLLDYFDISAMSPAGSINSSVNEMAAWVSMWIKGGTYKGEDILPAAYVKDAISSQMVIGANLPAEYSDMYFSNYGLGWMLHSYRGHYQVEHGGNIDGFSANVSFFPSDSIGIIVLTNQDGSAVPKIVRNTIADRMLKLEKRDWNGIVKKTMDDAKKAAEELIVEEDKNHVTGTKPSHALSDYEGSFYNPGYGNIELKKENDTLFAEFGKYRMKFEHYHYDYFKAIYAKGPKSGTDSNLKFSFQTGVDGKITSLSSEFDPSGAVVFERQVKKVELAEDAMKKYIGEYDLMGTTVTVSVKNNTLFVLVPGQTDYETVSVGNHTFNLTVAKGYSVVFEVDTKDQVLSLSFVQPNGTFKATRKK